MLEKYDQWDIVSQVKINSKYNSSTNDSIISRLMT